jgi:hypothetical protein
MITLGISKVLTLRMGQDLRSRLVLLSLGIIILANTIISIGRPKGFIDISWTM